MLCEICLSRTATAKCAVADSADHMHICTVCKNSLDAENYFVVTWVVVLVTIVGIWQIGPQSIAMVAANLAISRLSRITRYRTAVWSVWLSALVAVAFNAILSVDLAAGSVLMAPLLIIGKFP